MNNDALIITEAQLILAEKRTSLAALRTGIAVFALPLSVLGLLIATSKYYDIAQVVHLFSALLLAVRCPGGAGVVSDHQIHSPDQALRPADPQPEGQAQQARRIHHVNKSGFID